MPQKHYKHLAYEERCHIVAFLQIGMKLIEIASILNRSVSTISREIARNKGLKGYRHKQAQRFALQRKKYASCIPRKMSETLIDMIEAKLCEYQWSPEQIAGWLRINGHANISHESIYRHVWQDKRKGGDLYRQLRHRGKKRNKRGSLQAGRGLIPGRVDISERPKEVEAKRHVKHWEVDTIIGTGSSGVILSLVERHSKFTKLCWLSNRTARAVTKAIKKLLIPFREQVATITSDNGKEFAYHQEIAKALQAQFYFATPYHSWERGLNEQTNGFVRQYFPKSQRFDTITHEDVQIVENRLNGRPRKVLGFKTPMEVFFKALTASRSVALRY